MRLLVIRNTNKAALQLISRISEQKQPWPHLANYRQLLYNKLYPLWWFSLISALHLKAPNSEQSYTRTPCIDQLQKAKDKDDEKVWIEYLNIISQPVEIWISILNRKKDIPPGNDFSFRNSFNPDGKAAIIFLTETTRQTAHQISLCCELICCNPSCNCYWVCVILYKKHCSYLKNSPPTILIKHLLFKVHLEELLGLLDLLLCDDWTWESELDDGGSDSKSKAT